MRLRATRLTAIAQAVRSLGQAAYNPVNVFGSDLVTWYGNSVEELWAEHRKCWEDSPELVTNGNFDSVDNWVTHPTVTISQGQANFDGVTFLAVSTTLLSQPLALEVGSVYRVSYRLPTGTTSLISVGIGQGSMVGGTQQNAGVYSELITATEESSNLLVLTRGSPAIRSGGIDNISVRKVDFSKSRLFQDSTGTTPVTALEQSPGLILDKSKGLELGAPTIDGSFTDATGWAGIGSGGWSIVDGRLVRSAGQASTTQVNRVDGVSFSAGKWYSVSVNVIAVTGEIRVQSNTGAQLTGSVITTPGVKTAIFYNASAVNAQVLAVGSATCTIDDLVILELPGNHLSQATPTSRMRLSARYNLVTNTEMVGGSWAFDGMSRTVHAPDVFTFEKTTTASSKAIITGVLLSSAAGSTYAYTVDLYAGASSQCQIGIGAAADGGSGIWGSTENTTAEVLSGPGVVSGVQLFLVTNLHPEIPTRLRVTRRYDNSGINVAGYIYPHSAASTTIGHSIKVGRPDFRLAALPASWPQYQRVTSASDYDTAGFPARLVADGVDDGYSTGNLSMGNSLAASVIASAHTAGFSSIGWLANFNGVSPGSWALSVPSNTNGRRAFQAVGTTTANAQNLTAPTAPEVYLGEADILADTVALEVNDTESSGSTLGGGSFDQGVLYVGQRSNNSTRFTGDIFSLPMIVKRLLTPDEKVVLKKAFGKSIGVLQ